MRKLSYLTGLFIAGLVLPLSGCGFTPMHAPSGFAGAQGTTLSQVTIDVTDGGDENDKEAGFYLLQRLQDRTGVNNGIYTLKVVPRWTRGRLGISADDVASRYDGTVRATYELIETKTGEVLDKGRISATSTFGASTDPYGVIASNDAAMRNTAEEVADRLIIELATYFSTAQETEK